MYFPVTTPINPSPLSDFAPEEKKSPADIRGLMEVFEVATPQTRDEILSRLETDYAGGEVEAKGITTERLGSASAMVDEALASGADPTALRASLASLVQKTDEVGKGKATLESYLLANQPGTSEYDIRFNSNREVMRKKLEDRIKSFDDQSWAGTGWDFFDRYINRMVGQTYEDVTNRTARLGTQLIDIAMMEPAEAEKAFDEYLKGVEEEGVLSGDNYFAYLQAMRELDGLGTNKDAAEDLLFGTVDIVTGGTAALLSKAGQKAARAAAGRIGRVANIQGPSEAGRVASELIRKQDDVEAIIETGTDLINPGSVLGSSIVTRARLAHLRTSSTIPASVLPESGTSEGLARLTHFGSPATGHQVFSTAAPTPSVFAQAAALRTARQVMTPPASAPVSAMPVAAGVLRSNQLLNRINDLKQAGWFARDIDDAALQTRVQEITSAYQKRTARPIFNATVRTPLFEDHIAVVQFGTLEGRPFTDISSAEKFGNNLSSKVDQASFEVVQVDPLDEAAGYVIQFEERVKKMGAAQAIDTSYTIDPLRRMLAKTMVSSSVLDDLKNYARAAQGEAGFAAVMQEAKVWSKKINAISADSQWTLQEIFRQLRDGIDADIKDYYTPQEFEQNFMRIHPEHRVPTEAEMDAWDAVLAFDDATYFMKASQLLNKFSEAGFKAITVGDDSRFIAKRVRFDDIPENATVLEVGGSAFTKDQLRTQANRGDNIWVLTDGIGTNGDIKYILNPDKVGILHYGDVLGRNAGGRRVYREKFFVVAEGPNGSAAKITARTEKDAKIARIQIQNILDGIKAGDDNLDDLVRKNNDWDPSVDSHAAFTKWASDNNLDLGARIAYKADNGVLSGVDAIPGMNSLTWGERLAMQQSRSNVALPSYGGSMPNVEDPISAIGEHFTTAAHRLTNNAAVRQGIDGWVKGVLKATDSSGWVIPPEAIATGDYSLMFQQARRQGDPTDLQNKFGDLKQIIENRHNLTQAVGTDQWLDHKVRELGAWILDADAGLKKALMDNKPVRFIGGHLVDNGSPANNLLKLGFGSAFGFWNVSQFMVQAIHGAVMVPIVGSTTQAGKALALLPMIRLSTVSWGTSTGRLLAERTAKALGVSKQEYEELITFVRDSGRAVVDQEVLELGTLSGTGITRSGGNHAPPSAVNAAMRKAGQMGSALYNNSLMFYRAGEKFTRLSTLTTAFFEYKKKFPGGSALTDEAREWIMRRDQALGFHMTSAGRGQWQQGLGRFPTQWMAYGFRSMESVFFGRDLSKTERAKAAFAISALWGANGFGQEWVADWAGEKWGVDPESETYTLMKYGVIDALLDGADLDFSVSDRLAPFKGLMDVFSDTSEKSIYEAVGGASAGIAGNALSGFMGMMSGFFNGQYQYAREDFERALRTPSAIDGAFKAYGILKNGYLRSKTGYKYEAFVDETDALLVAMGFTPNSVAEENSRRNRAFRDNKERQDFNKRVSRRFDSAMALFEQGSEDSISAGRQMLRDIDLEIQTSDLSVYEQQQLRRNLLKEKDGAMVREAERLMKADKAFASRAIESRVLNRGNN